MARFTDEDYERIARTLRVHLRIDDQLRPNMVSVLQLLKHHGYIADYIRVPDESMPDKEARYDPDERKVYLRESVYHAAKRDVERARWTIAHEIGHFALSHEHSRNRSSSATKVERIAPTIRWDEAEAHRFAAALLAPFHRADFSLATTARQIADRFGISLPAAIRRVDELAVIFRRSHGIRRKLPPSVVDFLLEQRRKGYKVTSLASAEAEPAPLPPPSYEGEACPCCQNFTMIRTGLSLKCDRCGATTGSD